MKEADQAIQLKIFAILFRIENNQVEFLLLKNSIAEDELLSGKYYVVTGSVENTETLEDAVKREIFEETGITDIISIMPLNKVFKYNSTDGKTQYNEHAYAVNINTDNIVLSEEHTDYCWVNGQEFLDKI